MTFRQILDYTFFEFKERIMIDIYDSEALVKCYRMLNKKCKAIDKFIANHALYFGAGSEEYGSLDIINNIIDLMTKKNQLINLKVILDGAINSLDVRDKKILYVKLNYHVSMEDLCEFLNMKQRTAFRRVEHAYLSLTDALNNSKYIDKLISIMQKEMWISEVKDQVKEKHLNYKKVDISSL